MISTVLPSSEPPDVARAVRVAVGHVLGAAHDAVHLDVRLERGDGGHEADDVRGAAHVVLHLAHAGGGLDAEAAGVERDALADEDEALLRGFFAGTYDMCTMRGLCALPWPTAWSSFIPRFWISL